MNRIIKVMGLDPTVTNTGIAVGNVDIDTMEIAIELIDLVETESDKSKTVRKNSDDLRRVHEISDRIAKHGKGVSFAISEIPSGAQSARSAWLLGATLGTLTTLRRIGVPLIQVQPIETKIHSVGIKTATKNQMIAWAHGLHPDVQWATVKRKGVLELTKKNEHMADAIAVIYAGIQTSEFQQAVALMRSMKLAA